LDIEISSREIIVQVTTEVRYGGVRTCIGFRRFWGGLSSKGRHVDRTVRKKNY
jgi:hypothetical protein